MIHNQYNKTKRKTKQKTHTHTHTPWKIKKFCGTERDPGDLQPSVPDDQYDGCWLGKVLRVEGAAVELVEGPSGYMEWSGDESVGSFALTHDGTSQEIIIIKPKYLCPQKIFFFSVELYSKKCGK